MYKKELRLLITQKCNYDCYFCHREGMKTQEEEKLSPKDYEFLFKTCKEQFGWDTVSITGGEPLMRADVDEIVKRLYVNNAKITLITNGELLNLHSDILPYVDRINVSIHSIDENKYFKVVNRKNKIEKIKDNLAEIVEKFPNTNIRFNVVLAKGINDSEQDIMNIIKYAEKIGASVKFIELYTTEKTNIIELNFVEKILSKNKYLYLEKNIPTKKYFTNGKNEIVLTRIFCANAEKQENPQVYCKMYNDLFLTPSGDVEMCRNKNEVFSLYQEIVDRDEENLIKKIMIINKKMGDGCMMKKKLAIKGGNKVFENDEMAKFKHPVITKEIETAVIEQLNDTISIYDNSNIFNKFETEFAKYHQKKYGLVISSGTAALWSMYDAIGLKKGDEIICPVYTFFATNTPIFFTGATPVLADCDEYGNIDPEDVIKKITNKTKAIVVTHMWGYPCEMDKLREIADKHNLLLLEDCSHAHGGSYKGKKLGEWGDVAVFSLQGNKIVTGGEGGILITNNRDIFENAVLLGHYNKRCKQELNPESNMYKYRITGKGMKLRAHPLAIRIAYEQFKHLDKINEQKQIYAKMFIDELRDIEGLKVLEPKDEAVNSWYALIIKYDSKKMHNVSREKFVEALISEGAIEVDIPNSTCPMNDLELFKKPEYIYPEYEDRITFKQDDFKNAEEFYNSIIKLPVWYTEQDVNIVKKYIEAIKKVNENIEELL